MIFSVEVRIDGLVHRMDTLAELASDLSPPLKKFARYLRKKAIAKYKAQNFAPLAESTIEKRAQRGLRSMKKKLARELRRALGGAEGLSLVIAAQGKAAQRRQALLAEFERLHPLRGKKAAERRGLRVEAGGVSLSLKAQQSLAMRTVRAVQKAVNRPILGTLPGTLVADADRGTATLASHTKYPFTKTHNEGGTAGHGAQEPKRETISVDEEDLRYLVELLKEHHLLAFEGAA